LIKQKLPSLNEYTRVCRSNAYKGGKFKAEVEEVIGWYIKQALTSKTLHKPSGAVLVRFEWHEKTKRRDADNIAFAKKFILDALVKCGVLENDSRKFVKGFYDVIVDDKEDFVAVELVDIKAR
jgi:Holliday junction resolvase RusA-like endonuclease